MTSTWCGGVARQFQKITLTTDQAGSGIYTGFIVGKAGSGSLTDQRPVATGSVARGLIDNHASMAHGLF